MKKEAFSTERKVHNDESGMMVVECVLSFTVFLMVLLAIISLTNVFIIHNKVQFAINSAAHELASYSYFYVATGARAAEEQVEEDGQVFTTPLRDTANSVMESIEKVQNLSKDASGFIVTVQNPQNVVNDFDGVMGQFDDLSNDFFDTTESLGDSYNHIVELCSHPETIIKGVLYMFVETATDQLKKAAGQAAAWALTKDYIGEDADASLRAYNVVDGYAGLEFAGSSLFCDDDKRIVEIVVQYDIDMPFLDLLLPDTDIHMVQRASSYAWLDGDGADLNLD